MPDIYHQVIIDAKPEVVFKAITTSDGLSKWWMSRSESKPEKGFVCEFEIPGYIQHSMKIVAIWENEFLEWECLTPDNAWKDTQVTFEISDQSGLCILDFKHFGYHDFDSFFATCNFHWARHLSMLKAYCETGKNQLKEAFEIKSILETQLKKSRKTNN